MTNLLGYIPFDQYYISMKKFEKIVDFVHFMSHFISLSSGKPMQISVYRSQNGVRKGTGVDIY